MQGQIKFSTELRLISKRRLFITVVQALSVAAIGLAAFGPAYAARPAASFAFAITFTVFAIGLYFTRQTVEQTLRQHALFIEAEEAKQQVEELFTTTDMLQAADDHDDAGAVLMATARRLLPEFGGALYVFNNSRDRLDLTRFWNAREGFSPADTLLPGNCWALKRGKPHINDSACDTLSCLHHVGTTATIEVPMMARGQVFGLLVLAVEAEDAHAKLLRVRRVAGALADSMSLALSNIALREKLRTQSLRDPLTGLYNRRYMEDALDRYISLGERTGSPTSVVMIDLDNFKRLNDEHGHAKGDTVLREVARQLVSSLRPSDVVARYGGEELMVIMPNCGIDDAALRAETLRMRIEALSEVLGADVSASFGVATVPETATSPADIIPMADAALYRAKKAGKNCVVKADLRATREDATREDKPLPRLAVTG